MKKQRTGICPINFNDFNLFKFYDEYKNLKRFYLFNILNEFNFISEIECHEVKGSNMGITFDALTKMGLILEGIKNINEHEVFLNTYLKKLIFNPLVGYAMPIFKYGGEIYARNNPSACMNTYLMLDNENEFKSFFLGINDIKIIIYGVKFDGGRFLTIEYQNFDSLKSF